jgi:hypothetical protein
MILCDRSLAETGGICCSLLQKRSDVICHLRDPLCPAHIRRAWRGLWFAEHFLHINESAAAQKMHTIQQELPSLVRPQR